MRLLLILSALLLFSSGEANQSGANFRALTVNGEGSVAIRADIADVQLSIVVQHKSAKEAQQEIAEKLKPVMDVLAQSHAENLETGTVQIFPAYDKDTGLTIIGYKGRVTVQFSSSAASSGNLIETAMAAGANELSSVSLKPTDESLQQAHLKALELACGNAMEKAEVLLKTLKLQNQGIAQVSEQTASAAPFVRSYAMAKSAPSLELTEQTQNVTAHVQLQLQIN